MKAEDFLDNSGIEPEYYAGQVFGDWAYPRKEVINLLEAYAKQMVEMALSEAHYLNFYDENINR